MLWTCAQMLNALVPKWTSSLFPKQSANFYPVLEQLTCDLNVTMEDVVCKKNAVLRWFPSIALRILTAQNFTRNKCARVNKMAAWLAWERNHRFLVNKFGDLSFFFSYFEGSDQILSIKWMQINFHSRIIHYHWKRVLCQYSQRKYKELHGKYKVFLLLNEYGDPPFLF